MDTEKIKEVLSDESFVKELLETENVEDVQAKLAAKGVDLSTDEIKQIGDTIVKVAEGEITQEQLEKAANGELSEEELEQVAGGVLGVVIFLCMVGGLAAVGGGVVGATYGAVKSGW